MNDRLGLILLFEGDHRKLNAVIKNVTTFTAISAVLKQGDQTVTSTYINSTIDTLGNIILTDDIGEKATMPAGNYRYYVTGTYASKTRTWYWDILVLPKQDTGQLRDYPPSDYEPLINDLTIYEGDSFFKNIVVPGANLSAATGLFMIDSSDVTATYCNGTVTPSGDTVITHVIGGAASIPAGEYAYFITLTFNNGQAKTTYFYRIKVLPKQSII